MAKFNELYSFIDGAIKNRKYSPNTAGGHKAALKLFEKELNDEEGQSIDLVKEKIEAIYANVSRNNRDKISAESLATYKLRVLKVIDDYRKYGIDPTKMNEWISRTRNVIKSVDRAEMKGFSKGNDRSVDLVISSSNNPLGSLNAIDLVIRPGIVISIPKDINIIEAQIIKGVVDTLLKNTKQDEGVIQ